MQSILGHFELDFSKPYRQMDLLGPTVFFSGKNYLPLPG